MDEMELVGRFGEVDPLSPEALERAEAVLRAAMAAAPEPELPLVERRDPRWSRRRTFAVIAAAAVVLAGAGGGLLAAGSSSPRPAHGTGRVARGNSPVVVLTAAEVHRITARSSAAASSGTAEVTQTSTQDGTPQNGYETAVTFDGQNVDEQITSVPEPPGSAKSFTTDDRFVDGQFYIYTPGPGDVLEWLHDTDSANDAASMQFPDPRTLYGAISPKAQFAVEGTTSTSGSTITELNALDPAAIDTSALGNLAAGASLTSFELWVDQNDVVQKIALTTSATNQECKVLPLTKAEEQELLPKYGRTLPNGKRGLVFTAPAMAEIKKLGEGHCSQQTTATDVTVNFANLGAPQSVTAPANPVDYAGKG